jgi:hypothetical protein
MKNILDLFLVINIASPVEVAPIFMVEAFSTLATLALIPAL